MEYIAGAMPHERAGWQTASRATLRSTVHALYRQADEVICFGVDLSGPVRELVGTMVAPFLIAIETQMAGDGFPGDHGLLPRPTSKFDRLGYLSGPERRFTRGWSNGDGWSDGIRVVHVFPCFASELCAAWSTQRFASIVRELAILDIAREPSPYIEVRMRGGISRLVIKNWSHETLQSTLVYAKILAEEPEGVLEVRNLMGDVLTFGEAYGWRAYADRITKHALRTGIADDRNA